MAMMNRRGMVRAHSHWRPQRRPAAVSSQVASASRRRLRGRLLVILLVTGLAALTAAAVVVAGEGRGGPALPATPTAWLDAFSAGVARDSGDVCAQLVSPEFRAAMERDAHESCAAYYASARVLSIRVLRILRQGATAAIEIRYFPRGGYSTFVLNRQTTGWQAVAIVPGGPLPIA